VQSASLAAGIAVALYLPFVLAGHFQMGSYRWHVSDESLLSYFLAPGTPIGWPLRIAQGGCALAAGLIVARGARWSSHALWLAPGVVVLVRVLLDPLASGYYFVGIEGPALVGLALVSAWSLRLPQLLRQVRA
jgi:hypothetical protein